MSDNAEAFKVSCAYSKCGKVFIKKRYNQRFCNDKCRNGHFNELKAKAMALYRETPKKPAAVVAKLTDTELLKHMLCHFIVFEHELAWGYNESCEGLLDVGEIPEVVAALMKRKKELKAFKKV